MVKENTMTNKDENPAKEKGLKTAAQLYDEGILEPIRAKKREKQRKVEKKALNLARKEKGLNPITNNKHDYEGLYEAYKDETQEAYGTLRKWAKEKGIAYTMLCKRFHAIRMQESKAEFSKLIPKSVKTLRSIIYESENEETKLRAVNSVLDRSTDFSKEAVKVNIAQQFNNNVVIPPLFKGSDESALKSMVIDVDAVDLETEIDQNKPDDDLEKG